MLSELKHISVKKKSAILIALVLIMAVTFETFQQLYYIKRYDIAPDVTFFDLLKTQARSWLVWILMSAVLIRFVRRHAATHKLSLKFILRMTLIIFALILCCIAIIAVWQMMESEGHLILTDLISEYMPFYIFQKTPVFTLGYIAISMMAYLFFVNEQLLIQVDELGRLKQQYSELQSPLHQEIDDKTTVLSIKIGNKRKIIAVDDIYWIEADDYCVRVHTEKENYAMRTSLKALDDKLGHHFLRVHRKSIVNMNKVIEFRLSKLPELVLENQVSVTISKSNLKVVRDFIS